MNEATEQAWREVAEAAEALGMPFSAVPPARRQRLRERLDLPLDELFRVGWPATPEPPLPPSLAEVEAWLASHPDWPPTLLPVAALDEPTVEAVDAQGVLVRVERPDWVASPSVTAWRSRLVEWARTAPLLREHPGIELGKRRLATPQLEQALRERFPAEALRYLLARHGLLARAVLEEEVREAQQGARRAQRLLGGLGTLLVALVATGASPGALPGLLLPLTVWACLREQQADRGRAALESSRTPDPVRRRP